MALSVNTELPVDSIGIQTINGKTFIIHKVDEKETLYAISRRYGASVEDILQYNAGADVSLEVGRILKIPYTPRAVYRPAGETVHKVAAKETLYSISRQYGVSVDDIKRWNNLQGNNLAIGQELIIKKKTESTAIPATTPVKTASQEVISRKGVHTVAEKETLFSIARQYGVSVDDLKEWNNLSGNELKIGQVLYVAQPQRNQTSIAKEETAPKKETEVKVETQTAKSTEPTEKPVEKKSETGAVADVSIQPQQPVQQQKTVEQPPVTTIRISESVQNSDEIREVGLAELIEGTEGNRKYLALHRTAPVGTILKVRNEMNNREVFVRVMGKLPDTNLTNKVLIRISKSAYDRLGAVEPQFRVEVTYYK